MGDRKYSNFALRNKSVKRANILTKNYSFKMEIVHTYVIQALLSDQPSNVYQHSCEKRI